MEIKKNNNGKYNVELSKLDLVLIANALGNMSLEDYKIFCINYGEYGKDEEELHNKSISMYYNIIHQLQDDLSDCKNIDEIYSVVINCNKEW